MIDEPEDIGSQQGAAHEAYTQAVSDLRHQQEAGDEAAILECVRRVKRAERRWHRWVRAQREAEHRRR